MKTKLKIVIPAVIAVIAVIIAIIFIRLPEAGTVDIGSLMSTAQKYLVEMDYEQAIAEFEKIIELEPNNVDAYLGLAQAYRDSGDVDKAIEVLEKGYELTGDERLRDMLEELTGEASAEETETVVTTVPETETTTEITTTEEIPLMPDLVGMTTGEAVSACSSMGIKYTIQTVENSYVEPGIVLGQSVMADSVVDDDTAVVIMVSVQKQTVTETTTAEPVTTSVPQTTTAPITYTTTAATATGAETTASKPVSTTAETTIVESYKYTNEELENALLRLIDDPNADIDQEILNAITEVSILGSDYYAVNQHVYVKYGIEYLIPYQQKISFEDGTTEIVNSGTISNLEFVKQLKNLKVLSVDCNNINDITAISKLTNLTSLSFINNNISDISALSQLNNLEQLCLWNNQVGDISAILKLPKLTYLDLSCNPIGEENEKILRNTFPNCEIYV